MKIFVIVISLSFLIQAKCQVNYQTLFNHGISLLKNGAAISNQNVFSLQNDYEEIKSSLLDFFARDVISPFSEISADCLLQIQTLANATIEKQQWTQNCKNIEYLNKNVSMILNLLLSFGCIR